MQQEQYDLVFCGELVNGFELDQVKRNLQVLFRIDAAKVDKLFSGREVVLKKGVGPEAANKYRVAMKKAGARVNLVVSQDTAVSDSSQPTSSTPVRSEPVAAEKDVGEPNHKSGISGESARPTESGESNQPASETSSIVAPGYDLASVGADILQPHERPQVESVTVDISALNLAEQKGNLVDAHELSRPEPLHVDIPDIEVAPPGSDVLNEDERVRVEPVTVDLSGLSVAEPGERLSEEKKNAPSAPNVDHIRLAD